MHTSHHNPAKESLRKEQKEQRKAEREHGKDALLDQALEDTFPASDPVATQAPVTPGAAEGRKGDDKAKT